MSWHYHQHQTGGSAPATPGFNAVAPEWLPGCGAARSAAPAIPAAESTLGSHPCVALPSAQVLPEWTTTTPLCNDFSVNGDNPLNFVSQPRGSLQSVPDRNLPAVIRKTPPFPLLSNGSGRGDRQLRPTEILLLEATNPLLTVSNRATVRWQASRCYECATPTFRCLTQVFRAAGALCFHNELSESVWKSPGLYYKPFGETKPACQREKGARGLWQQQ